jgi:hypothetical protein
MMVVQGSPCLKIVAPASKATRCARISRHSMGLVAGAGGRFRFAMGIVADVVVAPLREHLNAAPVMEAGELT